MVGGRRLHSRMAGPVTVSVCALSVAAGCETMRQDIGEISLGSTTPSEAARMMMDTTDPDNRREGTVLISNSAFGGTDIYVSWYRDSVGSEPDPLVRAVSVSALGRHGTPQDAVPIALLLDDKQFQVRWEAAKALQRLHYPAVVPVLLATLRDEDEASDIRVATAIALGQYPQDRVFQALVAALDTPQLSINEAARRSLATLTGEDHGLDPAPWLRWYNGVSNPFAGQKEYLYPTYQREDSFLEKLAFWSSRSYEEPAVPTGLEPAPWLRWYNGVSNPFAGQKEYLYPTYQREDSFLEKLAFWSSRSYEEPAVPTGLEQAGRRTYSDSDEAATDEGG